MHFDLAWWGDESGKEVTLQEQYKQRLMEDSRLNKAATLAAEEDVLLNSNLPPGIKVVLTKSLSRQVRSWAKRVRQPGMTGPAVAGVGAPDADKDLAEAPISTLLNK